MDFLLQQWTHLQELGKSNPMIAGAISLWGLGVVTWVCRNIPTKIYRFMKGQLTTTLSFTNNQQGTNSETFSSFLMWFEKSKWVRFSRSISLNGNHYGHFNNDEKLGTVVGIGDGNHFFFYKGRPFWMTRTRMTQGGSMYQVTYEIVITTIGRNRQVLMDLIEEFIYKPPAGKLGIYRFENKEWLRSTDIVPRRLETVIINRSVRDKLVADIQRFKESRQWYIDRGLSYKLVIVLHGLPGSGKSSLIKALASHFNAGLALINLAYMSDSLFETALTSSKKNNFVLIEDFDSAKSTAGRNALVNRMENPAPAPQDNSLDAVPGGATIKFEDMAALTLSGMLNALDGVVSLDGTVIFMTTNVLETIDPALVRPGRVDHIYELGALGHQEVLEYIELMFPGEYRPEEGVVFQDIMGCVLQQLYFEHRTSIRDFVASIPKHEAPKLNRRGHLTQVV